MRIIADTHTHTLATDHAYSTLAENVAAAAKRGLDAICMTEHSPSMPGGPSYLHFFGLHMVPKIIDGIAIIKGIEVNIMDYNGTLDFDENGLRKLRWVIASMHSTNLEPDTDENHTKAWLNVAKNPLVDVIGHCGDPRYYFDIDTVLPEFKKHGKIVEINAHSKTARRGSEIICEKIAEKCAELEIPVVVSSDAHHASNIGEFTSAIEILDKIKFPKKLILNADKERFFEAVNKIKASR